MSASHLKATYTKSMFDPLLTGIIHTIRWLDLLLATLLLYLLSFVPPRFLLWYSPLFRAWCWIFIRALGVELKVHQQYTQALPEHFIVIANHPSAFEDIGMPALFKAHFLAKEQLKSWWILGRISLFARTLYVRREDRDSRKEAALTIKNLLLQGENIGLYPEGGCKGRRIFLPFQYGIFEASLQTGVPIIPVFIHYEAQADFEWAQGESLIKTLQKIYRSKNKTVNYYIFDPIDPKDFENKESYCEYVQTLYLKLQEKYLE